MNEDSNALISKHAHTYSISDIINRRGYHTYQINSIMSVTIYQIVFSIYLSSIPFLILALEKYLSINNLDLQIISSLTILSISIGNGIFNILIRYSSRKFMLYLSLIVFLTSYLVSSFYDTNVYIFIAFRIILGIMIGIPQSLICNNLMESMPNYLRGFTMTLTCLGWNIGQIAYLFLMKYLMPDLSPSDIPKLNIGLSVLCFLLVACIFYLYSESPSYLILESRKAEAYELLSKISVEKLNESALEDMCNNLQSTRSHSKKELRYLFSPELRFTSSLLLIISISIGFLFYGSLFIEERTISILSHTDKSSNYMIINEQINISLWGMIPLIISAILCEIKSIGRKKVILIFSLVGIFCLVDLIINTKSISLNLTLNSMAALINFNFIILYTSEIYSIHLRDNAVSFIFGTIHLSGFCSMYIYLKVSNYNILLPYAFNILLYVLIIIVSIALPIESMGKDLD